MVPKSVTLKDLKWRNGPILRYFTEFSSFRGELRKMADKAITMDNLRLLSSSKRLQRDRATPTV